MLQDCYLRVVALEKMDHAAGEISKMKQHVVAWQDPTLELG